jgi:heme/copper-type cytochrome/quinol oxidase subunit 2
MNTRATRYRFPARAEWIGRVFTMAAALVIGSSSSVFACPMCFGAEETSMIDGARLGVLALLVITLAVQGAFVGFFFYLRKRAKLAAEVELDSEWSKLQRASRTS